MTTSLSRASMVLAIYRYYFCWQRTLAITVVCGLILVALGAVSYPEPGSTFLVLLGLVLAVLFPVVFSCVAYRQLVGNRRMALVPALKPAAAAGLFMMAVTGGISSYTVLALMASFDPGWPSLRPILSAVLVFAISSLYLLLTQWLITKKNGVLLLFLAPLLLARLGTAHPQESPQGIAIIFCLAAIALAGWAWLWIAANRPGLPTGSALAIIGTAPALRATRLEPSGGSSGLSITAGQRASDPAGTVLRGVPDNWPQRLLMTSIMLLGFPLTIFCCLFLFSLLTSAPLGSFGFAGYEFLLLWSFVGFVAQSSTRSLELPARLRLLWLRCPGDRHGSWHTLDRCLFADLAACAMVSGCIALLFAVFTESQPAHLVFYVGSCIVISMASSYAGFWTRASQLPRIVFVVSFAGFLAIGIAGFFLVGGVADPLAALWLLAPAALLAFMLRFFARRSVLRVDWCAVKPIRLTRHQAT